MRQAALVPPPRVNLVRYHGVLAPHAKERDKVVPRSPGDRREARVDYEEETPRSKGRRMAWARRYLKGVGLPTEPPEIAPARSPPQRDIDF